MTISVTMARAVGCVLGSAVGDALGAPFEFGPAGAYSQRFPEPVLDGSEMVGSATWRPGEATDDTQMAIIEAEILHSSGLDYPAMYTAFKMWASDPNTKDVGNTTGAVLTHPAGYPDASWLHYQATGKGAANGCIMRAAPAAVWLAAHPEIDADDASRNLAAVTHGDPAAGWARVVLNRLLMAGIAGGDPLAVLDEALAVVPDDVLATWWYPVAVDVADGDTPPGGNNSLAWVCLAQAIWSVGGSTNFEEALRRAIDCGDDTDTVAAVAGAIGGARWGIDAVPIRWVDPLHVNMHAAHPRARFASHELEQLVGALSG